ncbi:MAG: hypothetical protein M3264_12185 [Thermoproteota archaeon]|nr:hypothetical protein [Thermoproteota archaeon]
MIARATAAMAPISTSLRGPIIKYGASCLTELIKTFLEKEPLFSSIDLSNDVEEQRLNDLG